MTCYHIDHREDLAADSYWVKATSCAEARRLVARNVRGAEDVENPSHFDCEEWAETNQADKVPPEGFIHRRLHGPVAIKVK